MKRATHPEAYDYFLKMGDTPEQIADYWDSYVIGVYDAHADLRAAGKLPAIMLESVENYGVLTDIGIVTESGETITNGPVVQIAREAARLLEVGNNDGFETLFDENSAYSQMNESDRRSILNTVINKTGYTLKRLLNDNKPFKPMAWEDFYAFQAKAKERVLANRNKQQ